MLTMNQLSIALSHARLKNLSEETGVSVFYLKKIKQGNGDVPYSQLKKVSDYFEGETESQ